jgi:hypothetical protein
MTVWMHASLRAQPAFQNRCQSGRTAAGWQENIKNHSQVLRHAPAWRDLLSTSAAHSCAVILAIILTDRFSLYPARLVVADADRGAGALIEQPLHYLSSLPVHPRIHGTLLVVALPLARHHAARCSGSFKHIKNDFITDAFRLREPQRLPVDACLGATLVRSLATLKLHGFESPYSWWHEILRTGDHGRILTLRWPHHAGHDIWLDAALHPGADQLTAHAKTVL